MVPAAQFVERGGQFLKLLRPGAFALQEAFDVGRNLLALAGEFLAFDELLRGRDQIAARALGNIHAGVGDADDVFDGKAVHGETGHAEAARDVMFGQHGIGGQPLA